MTEEDTLEMIRLAQAHAESEGDNGNAELSFKAGYESRETQIQQLKHQNDFVFERAMENGHDLAIERARSAKLQAELEDARKANYAEDFNFQHEKAKRLEKELESERIRAEAFYVCSREYLTFMHKAFNGNYPALEGDLVQIFEDLCNVHEASRD